MNSDSIDNPPSQIQCEFIGRIIRSTSFPQDILSKFVSNLLLEEEGIHWNDHTASVLTTCLQKKLLLTDETILNLSKHILRCSRAMTFSKSVKFATLVHTFISRCASQISKGKDKSTCVEILHELASNLKTLMRKPF